MDTLTEAPELSNEGYISSIVENNVSILRSTEYRFDDESTEKNCNASEAILSLGRSALPSLYSNLIESSNRTPSDTFTFTRYLSALAEPEDLDLVLRTLKREDVINNSDGSSRNKVATTLMRCAQDIITNDPHDKRLSIISDGILRLLKDTEFRSSTGKFSLELALALTNTNQAISYLNTLTERDRNDINAVLNQRSILNAMSAREHFQTWREILENREYNDFRDDYDTFEELGNLDFDESFYEDEDSPGFTASVTALRDDVLDSLDDKVKSRIAKPKNISSIFFESNSSLDSLFERAHRCYYESKIAIGESKTLLELHAVNIMRRYPEATDDDIVKELKRYSIVLKEEAEYEDDSSVPTIGVEVEVDGKFFPQTNHQVMYFLNQTGIDTSFEENSTELKLPPSYSAAVQARMIFELQRMGVIPTDSQFASMHINIGVDSNKKYEGPTIGNLSDLLTYAYVPHARVLTRNWNQSFIDKSSETDDTGQLRDYQSMGRIEFRTPRVLNIVTYRLLKDVQRISKIFSSSHEFHDIAMQFDDDVLALLKKYNLHPDMPSTAKRQAANAIEDAYKIKLENKTALKEGRPVQANLIDDARLLMHYYADRIGSMGPSDKERINKVKERLMELSSSSTGVKKEVMHISDDWREIEDTLLQERIIADVDIPRDTTTAKKIYEEVDLANRVKGETNSFTRAGVCKILHIPPLREVLMVKNSGKNPIYFFDYLANTQGKLHKSSIIDIRDLVSQDERKVRLARIRTGSNLKGEEYNTTYHFGHHYSKGVNLDAILHEEATKISPNTTESDYGSLGYMVSISPDNIVQSALFKSLQLSKWENATLTFGGYYRDGNLQGLILRDDGINVLPVIKSLREEDPTTLLKDILIINKDDREVTIPQEVKDKLKQAGIDINLEEQTDSTMVIKIKNIRFPDDVIEATIPLIIENDLYLNGIKNHEEIPAFGHELHTNYANLEEVDKNQDCEIRVDPEIDVDLNRSLEAVLSSFGPSLQEFKLYGSIARGQKRYKSDMDLLVIVDDDAEKAITIPPFKNVTTHMFDAYKVPALSASLSNIDLHVVKRSEYMNATKPEVRAFLDFINQDAVTLWKRKEEVSDERVAA